MRGKLGDDLVRVQQALRTLGKSEPTDKAKKAMKAIQDALDDGDAAVLVGDMADLLEVATRDGGAEALAQVGITNDDDITSLLNDKAVAYADEHAADLVGMKVVDGELVENPDADYVIDDSTREMLRADVETAMQDGLSNDALADLLADNYAFSDSRAELIARTETAFADVQGNLIAYKESGVVDGKQWVASPGCCDECQALNDVIVSLDDEFPNDGGDGPPLHPRCECDVLPVLADDE
jgi:SPP1 gp7 family putative phage head morphogenesis protein